MGITVIHALRNQLEEPGDVSARLVQSNRAVHNNNVGQDNGSGRGRRAGLGSKTGIGSWAGLGNWAGFRNDAAASEVDLEAAAEVEVQRLDSDGSVAQRLKGVLDDSDVALALSLIHI